MKLKRRTIYPPCGSCRKLREDPLFCCPIACLSANKNKWLHAKKMFDDNDIADRKMDQYRDDLLTGDIQL